MEAQRKRHNVRIGLVGVGVMGKCILEQLRTHNYEVSTYDPMPETWEFVLAKGGEPVSNLPDLGKSCQIIILSLPGPRQIQDVVLGGSGLSDVLTEEHIVIDTSTVDPVSTQNISDQLASRGIAYLDAPILGRPSAMGKWVMPVGGSKEALEKVRPMLETMATTVTHVGTSGSGNALKLLNQLMFTAINGITSEVLAIAEKSGVDQRVFFDVVANSGAATVSGLFREVGRNIIDEHYDAPTFTVDLMIKDAELSLAMARSVQAPSLITQSIHQFSLIASANGLGKEDTSAVYKIFKKLYEGETSHED